MGRGHVSHNCKSAQLIFKYIILLYVFLVITQITQIKPERGLLSQRNITITQFDLYSMNLIPSLICWNRIILARLTAQQTWEIFGIQHLFSLGFIYGTFIHQSLIRQYSPIFGTIFASTPSLYFANLRFANRRYIFASLFSFNKAK